ncbi:MAG: hypothetical protein AAF721_15505 [Myxococcota bacterium]
MRSSIATVDRACHLSQEVHDTGWDTVDGAGAVRTATYRFPGGVSRTVLLRLDERRFVAFSPGAPLARNAREMLGDDIEMFLVAPSAGHTMGVDPWREAFPGARVFAADAAVKRLARVTSAPNVELPSALAALLPEHVEVHTPPGSRTGELWLSIDVDDRVLWAVCDSFMNIAALADGFWLRLAQRLYGLRVGLSVGRVFRLGLRERATFRDWAIARFSNDRRNALIPCHGELDEGPDLTERIIALTRSRF